MSWVSWMLCPGGANLPKILTDHIFGEFLPDVFLVPALGGRVVVVGIPVWSVALALVARATIRLTALDVLLLVGRRVIFIAGAVWPGFSCFWPWLHGFPLQ